MEHFRDDGHLTDQALVALVRGEALGDLARLEIAEHLAYCDDCLQRYTDLLADDSLLSPAHSCRESLWVRIRLRTIRLVTSRYATAAAAVALALTLLWGSAGVTLPERTPLPLPEVSQRFQSWPERWNDSLRGALSQFNDLFNDLGGDRPRTT